MTRPVALIVLLGISTGAGLARAALQANAGLRSEYFAGSRVDGHGHTGVDGEVSTAAIARAWNHAPPSQFRVRWSGFLVAPRHGSYTFATTSDDGSAVAIDGERVVDNTGDHGAQTRTGRMSLERGSHVVVIDYSQNGGLYEMTWSWARDGSELSAVPAWALWTRRTSLWRALAMRLVDPVFLVALLVTSLVGVRSAWQAKGRDLAGAVRQRWEEGRRRAADASSRLRPRAILRVVLPIASLVIALLVAEGIARLVFRTVRSSGDARTFFATRSEPTRLNNLGFRDADVPAKTDRYRIVVIGDSITWGEGLPEPERFSNLLQRFLGSSYEVVNFGIPGHNMPEHLAELEPALAISPDFILLQLYTNDFEIGAMERPRGRPFLPWRAADAWLLRSSAIYTMLSAQWPRIQQKLGLVETYEHYMYRFLGDPQSPESRAGLGMLHTFLGRARETGVAAGTVMFPNPGVLAKDYQFAYLHDRVHDVCVEEVIPCVDLRAPFLSSFSDLKDIVVSAFDGHPSARASLVAADQILAEFRPVWRPCSLRPGDTSCQPAPPPRMTHAPTNERPNRVTRRPARRRR